MPPPDRTPAEPQAWRVQLTDGEQTVEAARGGVDVGAMNVGTLAYVVISDHLNRVVWMMRAELVLRVERAERCIDA